MTELSCHTTQHIQFYYDSSGAGKEMRKYFVCVLGLWHNYKQMMTKVYSKFSGFLFAPLYHHTNPGCKFYIKPKYLETIAMQFSLIRLAYPHFKDQLEKALDHPRTTKLSKSHLRYLRSIIEFIIPAVRH